MLKTKGRELLQSYGHNKRYIEELVRLIEELERLNKKIKEGVERQDIILTRKQKVVERIDAVENQLDLIDDVINEMEQPYRDIVYFRYMRRYSINKIALKLNYSPPRIYQLLDKAEEEFYTLHQTFLNNDAG